MKVLVIKPLLTRSQVIFAFIYLFTILIIHYMGKSMRTPDICPPQINATNLEAYNYLGSLCMLPCMLCIFYYTGTQQLDLKQNDNAPVHKVDSEDRDREKCLTENPDLNVLGIPIVHKAYNISA